MSKTDIYSEQKEKSKENKQILTIRIKPGLIRELRKIKGYNVLIETLLENYFSSRKKFR